MTDPSEGTDLRRDPRLRDLAAFAATFDDHPDTEELHRRAQTLVSEHKESTDLAELAAHYVDSPRHRAELSRSAREILAMPVSPMHPVMKRALGCYLVVLGAALLSVAPWVWSWASQVAESGNTRTRFFWLDFTATPRMTVIVVVIMMAMIGSVTVMTLSFATRAGHGTLERGFLWWYLTRPVAAASLAVLFYITAIAGFLDLTTLARRSDLVVAAGLAALAGLFTDQVLNKLRRVLGLSPPTRAASGKEPGKEPGKEGA